MKFYQSGADSLFSRILLGASVLFSLNCANTTGPDKTSETTGGSSKEDMKISLKEEFPKEKTCSSNIGVLRIDENGHSLGSKTEMTELKNLLGNKDCDICQIEFVRKGSYSPMPMKIIYIKREKRLKSIFTKTNVIEDYQNVTEAGLKKFLDKGEKSFAYLSDYTDSKYDFNNREMKQTAIGTKPPQSELDGSVDAVRDYLKSNCNQSHRDRERILQRNHLNSYPPSFPKFFGNHPACNFYLF